ncbi:transposase IS605 OrfB, partial [mine drainage metagenome]
VSEGEVLVPKAGWVKFRLTRSWPEIEASTSARVTLDRSNRWHVSLTQRKPELQRETTGAVAGLDMGIASTVTTSDG